MNNTKIIKDLLRDTFKGMALGIYEEGNDIYKIELKEDVTIDEAQKKLRSLNQSRIAMIPYLDLENPFENLGVDADASNKHNTTVMKVKVNFSDKMAGGGKLKTNTMIFENYYSQHGALFGGGYFCGDKMQTGGEIKIGSYFYIISDDKIKKGDWCLHLTTKNIVLSDEEGSHYGGWKKIEFTNDPALIKEGVKKLPSGDSMKKGGGVKNKNEISYKGRLITKLFPSGMYEVYSDKQERFVKFDELDDAKQLIDSEK